MDVCCSLQVQGQRSRAGTARIWAYCMGRRVAPAAWTACRPHKSVTPLPLRIFCSNDHRFRDHAKEAYVQLIIAQGLQVTDLYNQDSWAGKHARRRNSGQTLTQDRHAASLDPSIMLRRQAPRVLEAPQRQPLQQLLVGQLPWTQSGSPQWPPASPQMSA